MDSLAQNSPRKALLFRWLSSAPTADLLFSSPPKSPCLWQHLCSICITDKTTGNARPGTDTFSTFLMRFFSFPTHLWRMTPHLQLFHKNAQILWAIYNKPLWFCLVCTLISEYHQEQSQKPPKLCVIIPPIITRNHTHMKKFSEKASLPFRENCLVPYCLLSILHQLQSSSEFLCSDQTELQIVWQATHCPRIMLLQ